MKPVGALGVVLVVIGASLIAAGGVGSAVGVSATEETDSDREVLRSGERFAAILGVQAAELTGEVAHQAFDRRIRAAENETDRARAVSDRLDRTARRLTTLEAQKADLTQAYERGEVSTGQYRARLARLGAELAQIERAMNQTDRVAASVPEEALARNGVDLAAIERLRANASELGGGELAEMAREIAGPPDDRGREGRADRAESDRGERADRPGEADRRGGLSPTEASDRRTNAGAPNADFDGETSKNETGRAVGTDGEAPGDRGAGTDGAIQGGSNAVDTDRTNGENDDREASDEADQTEKEALLVSDREPSYRPLVAIEFRRVLTPR